MRLQPRSAGFTLVEVIIASVLIVVLLSAFLQLLASQARVASEESQDTTAQSGLITTIEGILPLLEEGTFRGDNLPNSRTVEFHVPIKDVNGVIPEPKESPNSGKPELYLGAGEPGDMILGDYYQITFEPEVRADQLIDEATELRSNGAVGLDLNQDGDKSDQFMYGTLMLRRFSKANIMREERNLGGRIAVPWPAGGIFTKNGTMLTVDLISLDMRIKGEESRIRSTRTTINLRGKKGILE